MSGRRHKTTSRSTSWYTVDMWWRNMAHASVQRNPCLIYIEILIISEWIPTPKNMSHLLMWKSRDTAADDLLTCKHRHLTGYPVSERAMKVWTLSIHYCPRTSNFWLCFYIQAALPLRRFPVCLPSNYKNPLSSSVLKINLKQITTTPRSIFVLASVLKLMLRDPRV